MPRAASLPPLVVFALLAASCASVPAPREVAPPVDTPFAIDGRLSARRGADAIAIGFAWTHSSPTDALVLVSPLGQTLAELTSDSAIPRAELRMADGRQDAAPDWTTLAERATGFPLPVGALAWWAQGVPRPDAVHARETDRVGRTSVLRQDGCEIVYAYADDTARRPARLDLACHDLEVRIVIDRWRGA